MTIPNPAAVFQGVEGSGLEFKHGAEGSGLEIKQGLMVEIRGSRGDG